ncbi:hypothetical protein EYF80_007604 [Liparis tanakae]|uniref:Uncharacterized protein n=1 Tax=Liparis tanakae TaxID=230148 RepID=A0A4Z2IWI0_9TELE|nr:hypothetical protein EYF80_007604 [Liparis tanakae]
MLLLTEYRKNVDFGCKTDYGPGCNTKGRQCTTSYSHPGVNGAQDGVHSRVGVDYFVKGGRKVHVRDAKTDLRANLCCMTSLRLTESHQGLSLPL